MSRIYPDCDYFKDQRDSEFAPEDGQCESCYRYDICKTAYIDSTISIKEIVPDKNKCLIMQPTIPFSEIDYRNIFRIKDLLKKEFGINNIICMPREVAINYIDKTLIIKSAKNLIKLLEEGEINDSDEDRDD